MGITPEEGKQSEQYQIFVGKQLNKSIHRVKGKNLLEFAESLGDTNPKYIKVGTTDDEKPDYSTIVAHPSYPNCFTVDSAFDLVNWRYPLKDGETEARKFITNYGKVLHAEQEYDYSKAETPIVHGQKLYSTGFLEKAYIQNGKLWLRTHIDTYTEDGKLVVQSKVMVVVREGGF